MRYEPVFAHLFGMHPWDIDRLTLSQFRNFQKYADQQVKAGHG